ncbi:MAG: S9 family peptidase [Candidatus Cloacimonetes bacterium]|nr:S9 family peptidase [Candidatus Cloacimonadota bacterium]
MKKLFIIVPIIVLISFCASQSVQENIKTSTIQPPVATKIPTSTIIHGVELNDDYAWMIDDARTDSMVVEYIESENIYADKILSGMTVLKDTIFNEIISRIGEEDVNAPTRWGDYYYYSRREEGKPYLIYCRKYKSLSAPEQIVLDLNKLAEGHDFFSVSRREYSPDQKLIAYTVDVTGDERYTMYIKDIEADTLLAEEIYPVNDVEWANDNKTIFYVTPNEDNLKSKRAYRHVLGADPSQDELLYREDDNAFYVWFGRTRSDDYIILGTNSRTTSDARYIDANEPDGDFILFKPREPDVKYYMTNNDSILYIRTNEQAPNYKIITAFVGDPSHWQIFIPHNDSIYIDGYDVFENYIVVYEQHNGVIKPHIFVLSETTDYYIQFPEDVYAFYSRWTPDFNTDTLYFSYSSLTTPSSVYAYNMKTKERKVLKRYEVIGGFNPDEYAAEQVYALSHDGTKVPISLVYKKDLFNKDGTNPTYLTAYGAYGSIRNTGFSRLRISLLDRGFVYAIAHVRGGKEKGEQWYQNGKLLYKKNTFLDFIACAEYLIEHNYTSPEKLAAFGASAGGMLMGVVANWRPDLFEVIVADVPSMDKLTVLLDSTASGTKYHYDELGNPYKKEYFDYLISWDTYQNIKKQGYPNMMLTSGYHDSRVRYWQPLRWTAKVRDLKTDDNIFILKTNMAGHYGGSGRYTQYEDIAERYAFIIRMLGVE